SSTDGPDAGTEDPPATSTAPATESASESESDTSDETTCSFVCDTTGGDDIQPQCDNWTQDCPSGEKCAAYADDGGSSWNNLKCVPAEENGGQPGDPCTVEGN